MQVGIIFIFQNYEDGLSDAAAYERDVSLASLAEPLGFDFLAATEHHFSNYSMSPDNMGFLAYMAGCTSKIKLLTGAVILPWHNPLRVIGNIIALDHLSKGRVLFGIGRGLARSEFEPFNIDMNESRDRFNEAATLILRALESGVAEGEGPFYKQKRVTMRPRPYASFKDRFYSVAMSPDSVPVAAKLGARMMVFSNHKSWEEQAPSFQEFRQIFEKNHGVEAPPPVTCDFLVCDESADRAAELAHTHMTNYYKTVIIHNEWITPFYDNVKGYTSYAVSSKTLREIGPEKAAERFVGVNAWGTPQQILDRLYERWKLIGPFDEMVQSSYGALAQADAEKSLRLYAQKVLPELRSWK